MQHKNPEYFSLIEAYIDDYKAAHGGTAPTVREISSAVGLAVSTVSSYLSCMREKGIIEYEGHRNISTRRTRAEQDAFCRVPVLGAVSCGLPKLAEENIEEYVRLPVALFGKDNFYILRAKGDSMTGIGVDDGDMVLVKSRSIASYNDVVVALVNDEATLKRFRPETDGIHLHAENPEYEDIIVSECIIQGIAVKVLKDLQ